MAELYANYNGLIRAEVRRCLPHRLRREFDSMDFTQEVWASVCSLSPRECVFSNDFALHGFITKVAYNKVVDVYRRRRDELGQHAHTAGMQKTESPQPSPSKWVIVDEKWTALAAKLPVSHLAVMRRLLEGYTQEDIARQTGISERTIHRILERLQRAAEDSS